ncbi:MAG TPA: methyltransferase domain-containing protein [Candidatus Binatia bacterium]|jgi:SAM-dependent methyltransferase|nr:methyltransferase domain-containing protein [Candidatus Binatia bacterium]
MKKRGWFLLWSVAAFLASTTVFQDWMNRNPAGVVALAQEGKIVPYVPTPQDVVERMLELAQVKKGDVVYDLGSGDGRIVITAAKKYGVKAIGFEIDPERIKESRENIKKEGVGNLVEIREQDIRTVDLSPATVLTMYLLPEVNLMVRPNIWKQMKPGSRVVSHDFDMADWKPAKEVHIKDKSGWDHTLYFWTIDKNVGRP